MQIALKGVYMGILKALAIAKEIVEIVIPIFGWLKKRKMQKKLIKTEKTLETVISGVEIYSTQKGTTADKVKETVKAVINREAVKGTFADGGIVEEYLNKKVKSLTSK